ncbi:BlaI/MecI/CopY family transcriptional regulator [Bacillus toyonensis]|uniref:BlaI/MecI/CopY family transcriptional regulator n=1 Tax=Bacillus toyonensis TaxID=155322 RepID=UPI001EDE53F0|nr:BlaI/MecI/CopY family transcriptional regulator [Bacillus toyonensis]MCG3795988.1 BlaI/MecI/CopY family transcriptional regulator [Bacillus toyonensis]
MGNKQTKLTEREHKVLSFISYGKENAITVKDIIAVIGGTDEEIRAIVRRLIEKHGYLVGSSNRIGRSGYYRPETNEEKAEAVSKLEKRAAEILKRANIMRNLPL